MIVFYSLSLFMLSLIAISLAQRTENCDASDARHIDSTIAKIITIGNSGRKFPENKINELKKYCDDTSVLIKQVTQYKNICMKDLAKQVTGIVIYSINNNINQLCRKQSKYLDELIESAQCMNVASNEMSKCYSKFIDHILGAQNALDEKKKIPYVCCSYFDIYSCYESRMKSFEQCTDSNIQTAFQFFKSLFGDVVNVVCTDYTEESDKCQKLGSPPKKKKSQRKPKSFIIPLIDLLTGFKEV